MISLKSLIITFISISLFIILEGCSENSGFPSEKSTIDTPQSLPPKRSESDDSDNHLKIVKKIAIGSHESYLLADNKQTLYFWKSASKKESVLGEIAGTEMANYITSGLVPVAKEMKLRPPHAVSDILGTIQPYIDMKPEAFDKSNFENGDFDPKKLTDLQKNQLFVHMIADRLIANYDTHTSQFSISQGNIIGFDKGHSFRYFAAAHLPHLAGMPNKEEPKTFNPQAYWIPLGSDRPVYPAFAHYLKKSPHLLQQIWTSKIVQDALTRCAQLSKKQISQWLQQYVTVRFNNNNKEEQFIEQVYQRAQGIKAEIKQYFSI